MSKVQHTTDTWKASIIFAKTISFIKPKISVSHFFYQISWAARNRWY